MTWYPADDDNPRAVGTSEMRSRRRPISTGDRSATNRSPRPMAVSSQPKR